ncbi:TetR/AcrR family transcriptional regulator [Lacticaseibacillus pantheris]|jgi:AcrR family transcriptional regulator|uniref:HTH tetR-type domain-containing protein n=1 Tax=Lacticaseibacillus pantheris DSM 15945 = JCM 12539 = NBRC 106106 TaxID=1423783 RepID=A0A0R1U6U1_9LACO|nr:TetR/AcrR family transcriptional regulator [Lacticaseibacillus pantheris]KRL86805.1 hypothetical protein FC50_GL000451 [Lacticaseibacillus pantheris DSM 15945 = JCM 12539 = NBRC 106106]WKF84319.1 TetR/AcrR family transcriptional regulator [Lacticaseibacillus pantheris]
MTDLRTQRTNRLIQAAFVKLVNRSGFDTLTVTQIAATALINRQTFYRHYTDKFDLAERLASEAITGFDRAVSERLRIAADPRHDQEQVLRVVSDIMSTYVAERIDLLTALMTLRGDPLDFRDRLQRQIEHRYRQYFADSTPDQEDLEIQASLFASVALGTLDFILAHKRVPESSRMLRNVQRILTAFV